MKIEDVKKILDGTQYRSIDDQDFKDAKESNIVVVFGQSDDLLEFRGAIRDEVGAWDGTTVKLDTNGLLTNECDDEDCPYFLSKIKDALNYIEAVWCPEEIKASWLIKSNIEHVAFNIMEDEDLYCQGIIFHMASLK